MHLVLRFVVLAELSRDLRIVLTGDVVKALDANAIGLPRSGKPDADHRRIPALWLDTDDQMTQLRFFIARLGRFSGN